MVIFTAIFMSDFFLYIIQFSKIFLSFWWFWLAILLYVPAKHLYLWTIRELKYWNTLDWTFLEIKLPPETTKTPKAMENAFHSMWPTYDPPASIRDYWIDGKWTANYSLEIVGRRGEVHFYVRTPTERRTLVESALYAEYPDIDITEAKDYIGKFGELPNETYDIWGSDFKLNKNDIYPLRTYEYWETEMTRPEKKVDPMATLLEFMTTGLKDGEECWIQIKASPSLDELFPYIENSKKEIDKLMKRTGPKAESALESLHLTKVPSDVVDVFGRSMPLPERSPNEISTGLDVGLMKLSPGETEVLRAIEQNLGKLVYETNVRFIYIAKKDVFSPPNALGSLIGYFMQFSTTNLNSFGVDKSKSKVMPWFFEARRLFAKKRKLFRYYVSRRWPWQRKPYLFSTAELATIWHFPGKIVAPSMGVPRVEVKRGGAPPELPI